MTPLRRSLSRWISALCIFAAFAVSGMLARAQSGDYVEGISEITDKTTAQTLDTYSGTYMTYGVCLYYNAHVHAALYQNDTKVAENAADGGSEYCYAELDGSGPITLGDTYTQVADHSIYDVYWVNYGGQTYYENPLLYSGFYPGNPDPSGTDYPSDGGGDYYMVTNTIEIGQTAASITAAAPSISDISPSVGTIGTSGNIQVSGEYLIDPWTQTATPAITGSGVSLWVGANPTDQQLDLNYSIAQGATAGPQSLTLATTFGTSNAVTFTVLYPAAQVTGISPGTWTAGQSYQGVQIIGTNFGSTPTVQLSDPSISVSQPYNTSTAGGASTTYVNVTVPSTTPSEQVTVTLIPGSGGNRFTQPPGGPSISGSNTVTVMGIQQNACPQGGADANSGFSSLAATGLAIGGSGIMSVSFSGGSYSGYGVTVPYGQFSTPESIASHLAALITKKYASSGLFAQAYGAYILYRSKATLGIPGFAASGASFAADPSPQSCPPVSLNLRLVPVVSRNELQSSGTAILHNVWRLVTLDGQVAVPITYQISEHIAIQKVGTVPDGQGGYTSSSSDSNIFDDGIGCRVLFGCSASKPYWQKFTITSAYKGLSNVPVMTRIPGQIDRLVMTINEHGSNAPTMNNDHGPMPQYSPDPYPEHGSYPNY